MDNNEVIEGVKNKAQQTYSNITNDSKKLKIAVSAICIGLFLIGWNLYSRTYETTDNAYIEGRIVPISARIPGYVHKIHVADNQMLTEDQLMLEIESRDYEIKLAKAKAELNNAQAQHRIAMENFETSVVVAPSTFESAKAAYDGAYSRHEKANKDLKRLQGLNELTLTRRDLDHAIADEKSAMASLKEAEAKSKSASSVEQIIAAAEAKVQEIKAQVDEYAALLASAEKDLADTKIYAPYSGRVTNRLIEVGTYVQPGQSLFSVVGKDLWVVANFKESQIHKIKKGQKVDIHIDAFPKLKFKGTIDSIQAGTGSRLSLFPPENATGNFVKVVQRVPVKITFDEPLDPELPLAVGMSVEPIVRLGW